MIGGPASAGASPAPDRLGPYRVIATLGTGGMGVVYRAEHVDTGEVVALKVATAPYGSALAGLRAEIHALTHLHHPGVVRFVAEGIEGGLPWYAMELLEGQTLERYIEELWRPFSAGWADGPSNDAPRGQVARTTMVAPPGEERPRAITTFSDHSLLAGDDSTPERALISRPPAAGGRLPAALTLMRRLCAPLTFLHGSGIVHRDLKPSNVFIRPDGTPVLVDFGLVSHARGGVGREVIAVTPHMQGTLNYISPEQIRLDFVDARSDLYALGCILYEVVTGRCPFRADTANALTVMHTHQAPSPPSRWVDGVPPALEAIILRLLAKQPRERTGHADDVAAALADLVGVRAEGDDGVPASERARPHLYRPELHGRRELLDGMVAHVTRVVAGGGGRLILVGGESGVGKTFLAGAVAREAVLRGARVVAGECIAVATPETGALEVRGGPLHPFRLLLQTVADLCRKEGRETTDRLLGPRGKLLAAYEPSLRELPGQSDYPEPAVVPAQAERLRILEALRATVAELARQRSLLLILDDLQWADELSLSFLTSLGDGSLATQSILVLGTYRSDEIGPTLRALMADGAGELIELPRLGEETVGSIVAEMLAMPDPPKAFVRMLVRSSEGNPFFVAEYLRTAVDEGLLYREGGAWRLTTGAVESEAVYEALPLPRSLRAVVGRRLHGLSPEARALGEVAAVLGREVDGALLLAVAGLEQDAALLPIKELLSSQVLEEARPDRFRFFHDKLREVTAETIDPARRRALHGAAAAAIEGRFVGREGLDLVYAELAHHYTEAEDLPRAIDYLEKAGEQAQRSFANHEAARFFAEALALDDRAGGPSAPVRRAAWERRLGQAFLGLGRLAESQQHLHRAVALLGSPMPQAKGRLKLGLLGQALVQLGHRLRPNRASAAAEERGALLEAVRAYDLLMPVTYFVTGDLPRILYATLRNLNLAERAGPSPELALAYANAQVTTGLIPWTGLAEAYGRRLHEILRGVDDPAVRSWSYVLAGSYACGRGDCSQAIAFGEEAVTIARDVGFRRRLEEGLGVQGAAQNLCGNFRAGRDISHALWESALRGDPQTQVWGAAGEAQNCLALGEPARALVAVERAERCLAQNLGRPEKIIVLGVLALTALRNGDRARARAAAEAALAAIAQGTPIAFYCITAYTCVAATCVELLASEPDGARATALDALARQACNEVFRSAKVFPVHRPRALLLRGDYEASRGRPARARRAWKRAEAAAARLSLGYEGALAKVALAESDDVGGRSLLEEARVQLRLNEAAPDLARVEEILSRPPGRR